jgi:hypothetical protein
MGFSIYQRNTQSGSVLSLAKKDRTTLPKIGFLAEKKDPTRDRVFSEEKDPT